MELKPIEIAMLKLFAKTGEIRGTAQVGFALWPDRKMQPQGAALAAGRVLRSLRDKGLVSCFTDDVLSKYDITKLGRETLDILSHSTESRQISLL